MGKYGKVNQTSLSYKIAGEANLCSASCVALIHSQTIEEGEVGLRDSLQRGMKRHVGGGRCAAIIEAPQSSIGYTEDRNEIKGSK